MARPSFGDMLRLAAILGVAAQSYYTNMHVNKKLDEGVKVTVDPKPQADTIAAILKVQETQGQNLLIGSGRFEMIEQSLRTLTGAVENMQLWQRHDMTSRDVIPPGVRLAPSTIASEWRGKKKPPG